MTDVTPNTRPMWRRVVAARPFLAALSLLFTFGGLWIVFRGQGLGDVAQSLANLKLWPFALSFAMICVVTLLRAWRAFLLLRPGRVPFSIALEMILIGYLFLTILPFRMGELVRIGYVSRRAQAPFFLTAAAAVSERALDVICLLTFAAVFLSQLAGENIEGLPLPAWVFGVLAGGGVLTAVLVGAWVQRGLEKAPPAPDDLFRRFLRDALHGFSTLGAPAQFAPALLVSVALWACVVLTYKFAFLAAGLSLPYADAAVVMIGTSFAIALPAMPGFVGTFHLGFVYAARLVGVGVKVATPLAIALHLVLQLPFVVIGGVVLFTGGRRAFAKPADPPDHK
jgi:glycosyltransferase 2 family protein